MIFLLFSLLLLATLFFVCLEPLFIAKQKKFFFSKKRKIADSQESKNRLEELEKDLLTGKISKEDFQILSKKFQ
jgi:hypothetical protein